jgi:hypothetical protein
MPVFTRVREGVLVLTADGDYTSNELRRVGFTALEADGTPSPVPVLLDLTGAAGIERKPEVELRATGAIFGAYRDRITRVAVVASPEVLALFDSESAFAKEAGVAVRACRSHADARAWLEDGAKA